MTQLRGSGYDRPLVETLVPTIWDDGYVWGMVDEFKPDPSMPKGTSIKKWGNTLWAHLVDIKRAWAGAPLTYDDACAVFLVGGMGMTHTSAAFYLRTSRSTVTRRYERGIGVMVAWLNGGEYTEEEGDPQSPPTF
ncbi:MAG TPA: hypothetical protein VHO01_16490 [Jatrophihabitans sp.]|nr:hypothetical protein [Jatrophihabitans sp.]